MSYQHDLCVTIKKGQRLSALTLSQNSSQKMTIQLLEKNATTLLFQCQQQVFNEKIASANWTDLEIT